MGRPPTEPEVARLVAATHDLDLRARGRLGCVRIGVPAGLDPSAVRALVADALDDTALAGVEVVVVHRARLGVLGGVFREG